LTGAHRAKTRNLERDFDLREGEERVRDEAVLNGSRQLFTLLSRQTNWTVYADAKIVDPGGAFELLGSQRDRDSAVGKFASAQILGSVKGAQAPSEAKRNSGGVIPLLVPPLSWGWSHVIERVRA
jgi:hypothetical protein